MIMIYYGFMELRKVFFTSLLIALVAINYSCSKDDTSEFVKKAAITSEYLQADLDMTYLFSVFHRAIHDTALTNRGMAIIDSATVLRMSDSLTGEIHFTFNYPDNTTSPDFKIKTGTIHAVLNKPFKDEGAEFSATFSIFRIDDFQYSGTAVYYNTGDYQGGKPVLSYETEVVAAKINNKLLVINTSRKIVWNDGFLKPENHSSQKFLVSGSGDCVYNSITPLAKDAIISIEIPLAWDINLSCNKIIRQGKMDLIFTGEKESENFTGEFIDADIDGCADKVMLKNADGFGFPYYI